MNTTHQTPIFYRETYIRWIGIVFIGLIFPLIIEVNTVERVDAYSHYWVAVGFATFYTTVCWNFAVWIMIFFRERFPYNNQTQLRIFYTLLFVILLAFFVNTVVAYLVDVYILKCSFIWEERRRVPIVAVILSVALCAIYEGIYLYSKLQLSVLEAQKFQTEHIKSQFEVLKNQIDPHFLFNSLNTLVTIIQENPEIATTFAEKLSQVYRYILQNKDKEVVPLETELAFVRSYIFLLQTRFEQNLNVQIRVGEEYMQRNIPPLSLQIVVENAIKHNIVSSDKPLFVDIYIDNHNSIMVKNNLQPKRSVKDSNKVGLNNIIKRYQYLTEQNVLVLPDAQHFKVSLPLLA